MRSLLSLPASTALPGRRSAETAGQRRVWRVGRTVACPGLPRSVAPGRRRLPYRGARDPRTRGGDGRRGAGQVSAAGGERRGEHPCARRLRPRRAALRHRRPAHRRRRPVPAGGPGRRRGRGRSPRRPARRTCCATPSTAIRSCTSSPAATSTAPARPPRSPRSGGSPSSGRPRAPRGCGSSARSTSGRTERDWLEWQRYEAVINHALADVAAVGAVRLRHPAPARPVLDSALRTHSRRRDAPDGRAPNPRFTAPADYLRALPVPAEPLEDTRAAARRARRHRLHRPPARGRRRARRPWTRPRDPIEDYLLAVDEMSSNAARHGRPPISLRLWIARRPHRLHDRRPRARLGRPLRRLRPRARGGPLPRRHGAVAGPPAVRPRGHHAPTPRAPASG